MQNSKLLLLAALYVLSACSKSGSSGGSPPPPPDSYEAQVLETPGRYTWASCDDKWHPVRLEIGKALDAKKQEIANYTASDQVAVDNSDFIKIGDFTFRKEEQKETAETWSAEISTWSEVQEAYEVAKQSPGDLAKWARLQRLYDFIFTDDYDRLVYKWNYDLPKDSDEKLSKLKSELENCNQKNFHDCLSTEAQAFVYSVFFYDDWWAYLKDITEKDNFDEYFKLFKEYVQSDWDRRLGFLKNSTVARVGKILYLPLRTTDFASIKPQLKEQIEKYWALGDQRVIIEWTDSPDAYELVLLDRFLARASVGHKSRRVFLSEGMRPSAIAHEIGHVLGFRDQYYTQINREDCSYKEESQSGNIMSNSYGGRVLQKHFDKLFDIYSM